jgi:GGDEF domain-containing protein
VDEHIRQTDIVFRDSYNRFVVLCPETALQNSQNLAERIADSIYKKTGIQVSWAVATFPDDALSFDDLLDVANSKLTRFALDKKEPAMPVEQVENEN